MDAQIKHMEIYLFCVGTFSVFSMILMFVFKYKDPHADANKEVEIRIENIASHKKRIKTS